MPEGPGAEEEEVPERAERTSSADPSVLGRVMLRWGRPMSYIKVGQAQCCILRRGRYDVIQYIEVEQV